MNTEFSKHLKLLSACMLVVFSLAGCTVKQMELTESGFLSGYSGLSEDEASDGMSVYRNPDINIHKHYSKIMIAPVQFKLDPTIEEYAMTYEDQVKLADYFHEKLIERLVKNYEIVEEPGKDVMLFRAAITDVLPSKVYLNLHWSTTLMGSGIGGASLEAEMVDSITGERILSFVDAKKGKSPIKQPKHLIKNYKSGLTKWGHTKQVLKLWADIMVTNLNELRQANKDDLYDVKSEWSYKTEENGSGVN